MASWCLKCLMEQGQAPPLYSHPLAVVILEQYPRFWGFFLAGRAQ
ncbi:Unknown protein sequence [Pseudomonas coronafaciens pv. oryzae]|nr:Unknown protein sequence [Pseudomonas coronafaciens pv. oryzae]